jgi:hypothetical protein
LIDNQPTGVALNRDIAQGEAVEGELDRLNERRSRQKDPDEESELWKESVRRYNVRREEELRAAWAAFHEGQAERHRAVLQSLIVHHETAAAQLREAGAINAWS